MDFLALSRIRRESVGFLRKIYEDNRQHILDNFYDRLLEIPEFNQVIHTHSTVERLKGLFDSHFISLFDDELDLDYVFKRRKIAYIHARIGVLPNWMISAYTLINQLIIPLIVKELSRDQEKMLDVLLSYDSLVTIDQQIILETYIEIQAGSVVNGLGEIITYNTQLDTVKELIEFQEIQQQEIIAADQSMHELDESIEDIATSVGDISEQTKLALKKLNQDLDSLHQVSTILQTTDEGHKSMQEDIKRLVERVNSVAKLMELIQRIADQTNLLELLHITNNISSLTTQFSQDLHQGVTDTLHITQTLAELNKNLQQQGARFEEIATTTKVQAQSATTISERNHTITESMQKSKVIVFDMGSAIYKLSKMIDGYRSSTISKNFIISQEDIIELAITDHLLWRWKIYNLLLGFETMTEQDVGSPKESRLGEWYYGTGKKLLGDERAYVELEQSFIHVHEIAKKAVREYNAGRKNEAEKYLKEISEESFVVIDKLKALKEILLDGKKQYIH